MYGGYRNGHPIGVRHTIRGSYELLGADRGRRFPEQALDQDRLRRIIDARSDEGDGICRHHLAVCVQDLHRQPETEIRCTIERHLDVDFEPLLSSMVVITVDFVTRSPLRMANVADDAGLRRGDPVILQLAPAVR